MKKITLLFALIVATTFSSAQGLEGIIVEKYYQTNAADSVDAANNFSATDLHKGSITYRVFVDMAPGYEFSTFYGNQDAQLNPLHPLIIKTTTNFYNDPTYGKIFPESNSVNNTKKNTTLIDSWLAVGGVCAGKVGVLKTNAEDTDGSIGNSTNGVLVNNPGGVFGAPINSVNPNALDGLMPGTPVAPQAIGITNNQMSMFDQTPGNTFSVTSGLISALGGATGVTPSNMILIGQFTTDGVLCFSLNIQITNTVTNIGELYVHNAAHTDHAGVPIVETSFPALAYCSSSAPTNTNTVGMENNTNEASWYSIYPNPSKGIFTIHGTIKKGSDVNSYSVYDITGRLVLTKNLGKVPDRFYEPIDMSDFNAGIYFVKVSMGETVSTKKIIKE